MRDFNSIGNARKTLSAAMEAREQVMGNHLLRQIGDAKVADAAEALRVAQEAANRRLNGHGPGAYLTLKKLMEIDQTARGRVMSNIEPKEAQLTK